MENDRQLKRKAEITKAQHENLLTINTKMQSKVEMEVKETFKDQNAVGAEFNNKIYEVR
jgi:hypothetical protein